MKKPKAPKAAAAKPRFFTSSVSARRFLFRGLLVPMVIWLLLFLIIPYLQLLLYSFWTNGKFTIQHVLTLENYMKFFTSGTGTNRPVLVLLDTLRIAVIVTVIAIILSYPLAYFINFKVQSPRAKQSLYMLAIIPLWISYVMRAYSWRLILGSSGILNALLLWLGVIHEPLNVLLYSDVSVIIAMVHIYTPYVLMPMYTAMEQIPRNLVEASKDLGGGKIFTFFRVVFPLSLPGVITGATYAFALSMGDFLAPSLLGGATSSTKIANIVQQQFGTSNNWPYGAAIAVVIFLVVISVLAVAGKIEKHFSKLDPEGGKTAV